MREDMANEFFGRCEKHGRPAIGADGRCELCVADETISNHVDGGIMGWTCPRCYTVHAPWIQECNCFPPTYTTTGRNVEGS